MTPNLMECPDSGLMLPRQFIDQRKALAATIDELIEKAVNSMAHIKETYYLMLNMRFNRFNPEEFEICPPVVTHTLPPFKNNSLVYWVCNKRGICELLWMVAPHRKGEKMRVEFNKSGVAYLQAKGAMPS